MSNWVGQTLGKVRIDTLLARGGTAEVYVGTHTTLQREVAIKVLHNNYDDHPHALERFQREAMVVGRLRHPNIVQVFDFDTTTDSHPYLVMEYIKGPSLLKYLNSLHSKGKQLDFPHVVRLMNAMTSALQYAHDSGVIHRDIKPGNILLTSRSSDIILGKPLPDDFEPVLTDFGLVRFIDSTQHTTGSGQIAGTPAYMSPEQARGDLTDGRTDIYSLGIVLYEILAGHLPFEAETTMGVLMKHISEPPAPIHGLPPTMQYVLDRALSKDLDERFQTPAEFGDAFTAAVESKDDFSTLEMLSTTSSMKKKPAKKLFAQRKQQRWVAPTLAVIVITALGAMALINNLSSPATVPPATMTETLIAPTTTSTLTYTAAPPSILLGRTGVLKFQNASALADQTVLIAQSLLAPPEGSQYEVWLVSGKQRISLGILTIDANGQGQLTFTDSNGSNLISLYNGVEITVEPDPDTNPKVPGTVAYSYTIPENSLPHIRYLLASYPTVPEKGALIDGLYTNIQEINDLASAMQKAADNGDTAHMLMYAESIQNMITGDQSPDYRDWNNDGKIDDPSDGFGLRLNGRNPGYLDAVYAEAQAIAESQQATKQMIADAEGLMDSSQNLGQWALELKSLVNEILIDPSLDNARQNIANTVLLTNKMLNGDDVDEDGTIAAKPGEGGAQVAWQQAYHLADMPLEAVGILNLGTGTPSFIGIPTKAGNGGTDNAAPTEKIPPGQQNNNTPPGQDKPPKDKDNNGSNSKSDSN